MYSRYMNGRFAPVIHQSTENQGNSNRRMAAERSQAPLGSVYRLCAQAIGKFDLKNTDAGDILLILIIMLLLLEGDNLETVVTLGLLLFWGFRDDHDGS